MIKFTKIFLIILFSFLSGVFWVSATDVTNSATLDVTPSVPVVTLTANPVSIDTGSSSTLTWTTTNSPTSCTASGDWSGSKNVSGSNQSTGTLSTARVYTYSLYCDNAGGRSNTAVATVTVSLPGKPNQATLNFSGQTVTYPTLFTTPLTTTGGSGTGAVSFEVSSSGNSASCAVNKAGTSLTYANAGECVIIATKDGDTTYDSITAQATFKIIKANQAALNFSGQTKTFPTLFTTPLTTTGGSGTGAISFEVLDEGSASCAVNKAGTSLTYANAGECVIGAYKAMDINYNEASQSATFKINKANQSISLNGQTVTSPNPFLVPLTVTGGSGTGEVTYSVTTEGAGGNVSPNGALVTYSSTGEFIITATKAADVNYNSASDIGRYVVLPPDPILTVTNNLKTTVNVTSNPVGISCGSDCTNTYTSGTTVRVTAPAIANQSVVISGGCSASGAIGVGAFCDVLVNADKTVDVVYTRPGYFLLSITKGGTGTGTVTGTSSPTQTNINCGSICDGSYSSGTNITLTASPSSGVVFEGWSGGGCTGTGTCSVTMDQQKSITATFNTIINGATVTLTANPTTVASGGSSTLTWVVTGSPTSCNALPLWPQITIPAGWAGPKAATNGTHTQTINNITSTTTYSMQCDAATASAVVTVGGGPMSGSITASDCSISAGNSSCSSVINWNTTNPVATSTVTTPTNITVANGNSGLENYTISYGSKTFYLNNNGTQLGSDVANASCVSGASWNGSFCNSNSGITGDIYGSDCYISAGSDRCNASYTWETTNHPSSPTANIYNVSTNPFSLLFSANSGSGIISVIRGSLSLTLYDRDGYILDSHQLLANCGSGTIWNGSICVSNVSDAVPWIDANPETNLKYNSKTTLSWGLTSGSAASCILSGGQFGTGTSVGTSSSGLSTSPLKKTTTFEIECGGNGNKGSVNVTVLPPDPTFDED